MTVEDRRGIEGDAVLPDEDTCRLRRIVMARHVSPVAVSRPGEDLRAVEAVLGNFPDGAGRGERRGARPRVGFSCRRQPGAGRLRISRGRAASRWFAGSEPFEIETRECQAGLGPIGALGVRAGRTGSAARAGRKKRISLSRVFLIPASKVVRSCAASTDFAAAASTSEQRTAAKRFNRSP